MVSTGNVHGDGLLGDAGILSAFRAVHGKTCSGGQKEQEKRAKSHVNPDTEARSQETYTHGGDGVVRHGDLRREGEMDHGQPAFRIEKGIVRSVPANFLIVRSHPFMSWNAPVMKIKD